MVLIEGGTFTMGKVQDDVMYDWNTAPVQMQVRSFYLDEAEVTNLEYVFYLQWLEKVFPPSDPNFKHIYASALPDTLVWRNTLGNNELLTEGYLRHLLMQTTRGWSFLAPSKCLLQMEDKRS